MLRLNVQSRLLLSAALGLQFLLASADVGAAGPHANAEASKFITDTVSTGLKILGDAQLDQTQREARVAALVRQNVDVARAARFVLGRYWNSSTAAEHRSFAQVYADYIARTYAKALPYFSGATLEVVGTIGDGDDIKVKTIFDHGLASKPAVCWNNTVYRNGPMCRGAEARWDVGWQLHRTGDGFKIVDVDVEGESLLLNQRDEFASLIARGGGTVAGLTRIIAARVVGKPSS